MSFFSTFCRVVTIAATALILGACSLSNPTLQETRDLELVVSADSRFEIEAGAGKLILEGDEGTSIRIQAEIYQTIASDDYRLILESDGDQGARLISETTSTGLGMSDYIDLSIRVPASVKLRIEDGSGSIRISNLTNILDIDDGSGSITISNVGGTITVDDSSGSLSIENAGGDVMIDDGSGSITVVDTAGTVTIRDGSGSITVREAGDFELLEDGSGSVNLKGIRNSSK